MKNLIKFIMIAVAAVMMSTSCARINAGYEGIKVNLYGNNKVI